MSLTMRLAPPGKDANKGGSSAPRHCPARWEHLQQGGSNCGQARSRLHGASAGKIAANLEWNASKRLPVLIFEEQRVLARQRRPGRAAMRIREHRIADAPIHSGKYGRSLEHDTLMFVGDVRIERDDRIRARVTNVWRHRGAGIRSGARRDELGLRPGEEPFVALRLDRWLERYFLFDHPRRRERFARRFRC